MAVETWLRVVIYRAQDPDDEQVLAYMKASSAKALSIMQGQPGFRLGYWGRNPAAGTMAAVSYWTSREAIEDAEPALAGLRLEREARGVATESVRNVQLFALPADAVLDEVGAP